MKEACEGEVNQAFWLQAGVSVDLRANNVSGGLKPTMADGRSLQSLLSLAIQDFLGCTGTRVQIQFKNLIYFGHSIKNRLMQTDECLFL